MYQYKTPGTSCQKCKQAVEIISKEHRSQMAKDGTIGALERIKTAMDWNISKMLKSASL